MDPNTGEVAIPDGPIVSEGMVAPEKPAERKRTPADIAREEMAKRAQARREKGEAELRVDILEEDGSITATSTSPAEEPPASETPEPGETPDDETITAAQAEAPIKPEAPRTSAPAPAPEEERELIVDGKRIRVPVSRILDAGTRTLQKETAADMRLAAATELLKSAQEQRQAVPVKSQEAQPSDDDAALARAIQFGTEDEAKAAIAKLRNATPSVTPQQIDAYVQQTLTQRLPDHQAFHAANAWLRTEYSAITTDPDLKLMFDMKEDQARKQGDRRPYSELYADIAGQMATKFNLQKAGKPAAPSGQTTQASDRITRKATGPRPITGASGRVEKDQGPPRQETVAEYVQRRRIASGQQPLEKQG